MNSRCRLVRLPKNAQKYGIYRIFTVLRFEISLVNETNFKLIIMNFANFLNSQCFPDVQVFNSEIIREQLATSVLNW